MSGKSLDRRDFSRLSLAAFGGAVTGATALAQNRPRPIAPPKPVVPPPTTPKPPATKPEAAADPRTTDAKNADPKTADAKSADAKAKEAADAKKKEDKKPKEIHICRGLNTCKEKGKSGTNKCAGRGDCATTPGAPHECATGNLCKGQGGCGPTAGKNQCNGLGDGSVPILEEEWPRLRAEFEARMKRLKRPFGPAPLSEAEQEWQRRKEEADAKAIAEAQAKAEAEANGEVPPEKRGPAKTTTKRPAPGSKDAASSKERPKPGTGRTVPKTPVKEEDTKDILGELTGDKDKKPAPKPAPK